MRVCTEATKMTGKAKKGVLNMERENGMSGVLACSDITRDSTGFITHKGVTAWNQLQSLGDASAWKRRQPVQVSLHCRKADDPQRRT